MGVNGTYNLMITDLGDDEIDLDYVLFQLRRDFEDAKYFLNEKGTSSGSEGYWDNIEQDLCDFSRKHMTLRFFVDIKIEYDDTEEERLYVQNGKSLLLKPVATWPEFRLEDLQ